MGVATPEADALRRTIEAIAEETLDDAPEHPRDRACETAWTAAEPAVVAAVEHLNGIIAPVGLRIEAPGTPAWSFKNRGFGAHRRITERGESRAWLRCECDASGALVLKVRAHRDELAAINTGTRLEAGRIDPVTVSEALAKCLRILASGAAWVAARSADQGEPAAGWADIAEPAQAALNLVASALSQSGASLVAVAEPALDPVAARWRWPIAISFDANPIALMHVDRDGDNIEVAVGVSDPQQAQLGRRKRIEIAGMSVHALAEVMASAAWPAIAAAREQSRSGRPAA